MHFHKSTYLFASITLLSAVVVNAAPTPGIGSSRETQGSTGKVRSWEDIMAEKDLESQWGQVRPQQGGDPLREMEEGRAKNSNFNRDNFKITPSKEQRKPAPAKASLPWDSEGKPNHVAIDIPEDDETHHKSPFGVTKEKNIGNN